MQSNDIIDSWFIRNLVGLKTFMRIIFGLTWLINGLLKFSSPDILNLVPEGIISASQTNSPLLKPWFQFWANIIVPNPGLFVYGTGLLEIFLGLALILGFLRKIMYYVGMILSLLIWSIPEGFRGPYGSGSADIGTGIIYSFVFLSLIIINATYGTSKYSLDSWIEKRLDWWKFLAEIKLEK